VKQIILIMIIFLGFIGSSYANDLIKEADGFFELRGEGYNKETLLASTTNIDKAIGLYKQAAAEYSGIKREEAIAKMLQSYYFKGRYAMPDKDSRKAVYEEAIKIGEESLKEYPESAAIHVMMAAILGVWSQDIGMITAARSGVANKIREHCEVAMKSDDIRIKAGGYRILGRVHSVAPKIPFILGWPSKKKGVELLEKALEMEPKSLITKYFLAEALYERDKKERAIKLMEEIPGTNEMVHGVVEDAVVKRDATENLKKWNK
jgi:tetratricopeptide (TPR) repeat protein